MFLIILKKLLVNGIKNLDFLFEIIKNNLMRINKYLALAGIASRRKCDELISAGKIKVNGKIVQTLGMEINVKKDKVLYLD